MSWYHEVDSGSERTHEHQWVASKGMLCHARCLILWITRLKPTTPPPVSKPTTQATSRTTVSDSSGFFGALGGPGHKACLNLPTTLKLSKRNCGTLTEGKQQAAPKAGTKCFTNTSSSSQLTN